MVRSSTPVLVADTGARAAAAEQGEVVRYFSDDAGNVGMVTAPVESAATIPRGTHEITEAEYRHRLTEINDINDNALQAMVDADTARARDEYDQLTALGLSAGLAARLSGHTPDGQTGDGQAVDGK